MRVGIALGSNVGDRAAHLRNAIRALENLGQPPILVSRIYETVPVDCPPGSGNFLNAAVEIGWESDVRDLMNCLQIIEIEFGRATIRPRNSPRPLDLDILYADHLTIDEPDLRVPHPRMFERAFVLGPLRDIVPHFRPHHPEGPSISEALEALPAREIAEINVI